MGDLIMASGRGATGWTGRVCLAANFFRLTLLFSNMSSIESCFWKTRSTWSCNRNHHSKHLLKHYHDCSLFFIHCNSSPLIPQLIFKKQNIHKGKVSQLHIIDTTRCMRNNITTDWLWGHKHQVRSNGFELLTRKSVVSTDSYSLQMPLKSVSLFWLAVSR